MSDKDNDVLKTLLLNGQEGTPKYILLRNALASEILSGRWSPGVQLPSEEVLAAMSAVSLGTVQRSLRMLVEEGRLLRKHGVGTFVAETPAPLGGPFQHFRFLEERTGAILPIFTKVLRRAAVGHQGPWTPLLQAAEVVCIDRLFSINDEFNVYVRLYFDGRRFPDLARRETSKLNGVSFKDLIAREYHQPTAKYDQTLRVVQLPDFVREALNVKSKVAGCLLELAARDRKGVAIYFQEVFIPPNARRLIVSP